MTHLLSDLRPFLSGFFFRALQNLFLHSFPFGTDTMDVPRNLLAHGIPLFLLRIQFQRGTDFFHRAFASLDPFSHGARNFWQIFGPDDNKRDQQDHYKFA